ncbi:RnfABCDGE type electron transport complex subunit D [Candidatus Saccharibacteria bacterium]|nr:RnfABCDGE type electron transport complex subunit D [Candidatus Saccharibacteria bacterium]
MKLIDYVLDRITMYRLVLYYLLLLIAAAMGLSLFGYLHYNPLAIAFSAGYITVICWLTNIIFSKVFEAPSGIESSFITALILTLIITPYHNPHDLLFLTVASGLAMASKYILAIRKKHIFNPAAVAVALTAAGAGQAASWWIGSTQLLPFVIVGGVLVVIKIQRGVMVSGFLGTVLTSTVFINLLTGHDIGIGLKKTVLHSSLFFLAFIMLTEPQTSPSTIDKQFWYGIIVGLLFSPQVHVGSVYSTPELTLLVKLLPSLRQKIRMSPDIADFVFAPNRRFTYKPGQYMEWTLPHSGADSRGNRRYLTLASSPTEENIRIGVRFYPNGSSFKRALLAVNRQTRIAAGQLGGDFVLPQDPSQKLVFIAGGIGITPYRSMIKYLIDINEHRQIALLYSEKNQKQLVYTDIFNRAKHQLGLKLVYTLTDTQAIDPNWMGERGSISSDMIQAAVPDYQECLFYISGSHSMVTAVEDILDNMGVASHQIKTDYFPGYV